MLLGQLRGAPRPWLKGASAGGQDEAELCFWVDSITAATSSAVAAAAVHFALAGAVGAEGTDAGAAVHLSPAGSDASANLDPQSSKRDVCLWFNALMDASESAAAADGSRPMVVAGELSVLPLREEEDVCFWVNATCSAAGPVHISREDYSARDRDAVFSQGDAAAFLRTQGEASSSQPVAAGAMATVSSGAEAAVGGSLEGERSSLKAAADATTTAGREMGAVVGGGAEGYQAPPSQDPPSQVPQSQAPKGGASPGAAGLPRQHLLKVDLLPAGSRDYLFSDPTRNRLHTPNAPVCCVDNVCFRINAAGREEASYLWSNPMAEIDPRVSSYLGGDAAASVSPGNHAAPQPAT